MVTHIELGVAILGGFSAPLLFLTFSRISYFSLVLYLTVFGIGTLVGLEIPLLMRILKDELDFKDLVSRVLAFDYITAPITIGDQAWLASDVFVAPGVTVGRGAVVGTRSTVLGDIAPEMVAFGAPARAVRKRRDR